MISSVDRRSSIPYYQQVIDHLRELIKQGSLKPGDQIPGEAELCAMFNVSRTVVRQALSELMHEGLIIREKGRGTFVAEPKISQGLVQNLTGFYEDMVNQGYKPITKIFKQQMASARSKVAKYLGLEIGAPVIEIERLRSVEDNFDEPIILDTTYLPYALCPQVLQAQLTHTSLYRFLGEMCGLKIARAHRILEAVSANEYESYFLKVAKGAPLLMLESISYLADGTPIEYYHGVHRGDRSRFEVDLIQSLETNMGARPMNVVRKRL